MAKRRVVVTGLGLISPVGNTVAEGWRNVRDGISGIAAIDRFDVSKFSTRFAGTIKDFDISEFMPAKEARKCDPFVHYGIAATANAIADSGLEVSDSEAHRIGVAMGSGIGGINTIEVNYDKWLKSGPRRISPFFVPATIINMISGHVSIMYGMMGPNLAIVTACTTSTHCIGLATRLIQSGDADVMYAGGAEFATTPLGLGGFCAARALSVRNDEPERASRPWDRDRDGFVLSDGAGCVALEEYEHAKARGAKIYAEVAGFGMSADAYHITAPEQEGAGAHQCMANALRDAELNETDVEYINAHGTSTPLGDFAETVAIKRTFADHARRLAISSTKSVTGHMIGAAGAAEAIFTIMALNDQLVPPTINLEDQDPQCDLDYTPNAARDAKLDVAVSNSFGFGGTNGTLILKRPE
ncbi:beta-ketoacyl-ACP synthase II [Candidatus Rariloculus sp.]|uniref:beta-ketoacyl-ACP synthase II n=1 Tax=Candidatus Rariloculus sp. TaxID=3101265 RepID=UPI003D0BC7AF